MSEFNFKSFVEEVGKSTVTDAARYVTGWVGGLVEERKYKSTRRAVVKAGMDVSKFSEFDAFMTTSAANNLKRAFCRSVYYNMPAEEAAQLHSSDAESVQAMIDTNCLGLFADWVKWPRKLVPEEPTAAPVEAPVEEAAAEAAAE